MNAAGQRLRQAREQLGLSMRDVEAAAARLVQKYGSSEFSLPISRLSDIEAKGNIPSIHRTYSLSVIYRRDIGEILSWYDVDLSQTAADVSLAEVRKTHLLQAISQLTRAKVPIELDPAFDLRMTSNFRRMIKKWGVVPAAFLSQFDDANYAYGYIGLEDFTMYPLIQPGSFVQVDERDNKVRMAQWRSEFERPIYLVETRDGHVCCWCAQTSPQQITLQPHHLSPVTPRILRYPQDAEVVGRVVAIAMRLDEWSTEATTSKVSPQLN